MSQVWKSSASLIIFFCRVRGRDRVITQVRGRVGVIIQVRVEGEGFYSG